ncbi:MAG: Rpn family recombination-promoting nuclease/putative transposase, partial [Saprospiraceae bacterium]|nr:Rpn family recombination-promoting nuclease/putative transposase [Saprospiraceae bacterium]
MRYLDPKNDLIFKRVFGEHANILKSFLNALLPLEVDQVIQNIDYLPTELVPELPMIIKNSIVDVRCEDNKGRQFIVEMQMLWTDSFKSRVLFNAAKAYVRQLDKGVEYSGLQPVYALSIVNEIFDDDAENYYHHYRLVHNEDSHKIIEGLQLVFVELPKFKPKNIIEKKLNVLWLRYLSEIENGTEMIDETLLKDLMSVPEIAQALELTKESAYTKAELEAYDRYWDTIRTERTLIADAEAKGKKEGFEMGTQKGKIEGKKEFVLKSFDNNIEISV